MNRTGGPIGQDGGAVRVAFIGATGRSGSTLVSRVLGSVPGVCSVGELCWLWNYGLLRNRLCGCGEPFLACSFWRGVGDIAFGGWSHVDAERAITLRRRLTANARLPRLWVEDRRGIESRELTEYRGLMSALYRGIQIQSGARVVVDNSKQAAAGLIVRRAAGVEMRLVHLVRRSHGVAYSWAKHVARSDLDGNEMRRRSPARTAARWTLDNALFEALGRSGTERTLLRYEDFVADARVATECIMRFLSLEVTSGDLSFVRADSVDLGADHSVWGNPMRLRSGREELRPDEAWRTTMAPRDRRLVTGVSALGLARYGYLGPAHATG